MTVTPRPTWPQILLAMLATGLVVGLTLGVLGTMLDVRTPTAGVGAAIGIVGALLVARRRQSTRERMD